MSSIRDATVPGDSPPLGAHWDGRGVTFSLWSENATAVELCLFDGDDAGAESRRLDLARPDAGTWSTRVEGARPGQRYGYRVHGPHDPDRGHRFNPAKLLIDPWARAVTGALRWDGALCGTTDEAAGGRNPDPRDSGPLVPRSVVVDPAYDWKDDRPPRTPRDRTVVYECHVRGLTRAHPLVPEALRGSYLGLAEAPVLEHLVRLGMTAVELMPVQHFVSERHLLETGRANYWGYSPVAFFAPHSAYAVDAGRVVGEFRDMVRALHAAGLEVILDVCYGHSAEGGTEGPTLLFRGLDNLAWYALDPLEPRRYLDWTGCGNTLDIARPAFRRLVHDSLRYWVREMHVDGFRFDQAAVLMRAGGGEGSFVAELARDEALAGVKLIAEPWDLGPDGYALGRFPAGWSEWNDRCRQDVRSFWRGDRGMLPALATRLSGSSDVFGERRRGPLASVSYVTCHDGFTLADLVSYASKHNQDNGEDNRDGSDDNRSRNWGVEGGTADERILRRRERARRSLLATLAFSSGVPLLSHGDELGRTQRGNNNAYCSDSEISWVDWTLDERRAELLDFARRAFALRRDHPALRTTEFFTGAPIGPGGPKDVAWLRPEGGEMSGDDWHAPERRAMGMLLAEGAGRLLLLLNAAETRCRFQLPVPMPGGAWRELLHSTRRRTRRLASPCALLPPSALVLLAEERAA